MSKDLNDYPAVGEPVQYRGRDGQPRAGLVINIGKRMNFDVIVIDRNGLGRMVKHVRYSERPTEKLMSQINRLPVNIKNEK